MQKTAKLIEVGTVGLFAIIASLFGQILPICVFLCFIMSVDYITGWYKSWLKKEITSRRGFIGFTKKVFYLFGVVVGFSVDILILYLSKTIGLEITYHTFFGLLVAIWLIINEMISILENLKGIGVPLPTFLENIIKALKIKVEEIHHMEKEK